MKGFNFLPTLTKGFYAIAECVCCLIPEMRCSLNDSLEWVPGVQEAGSFLLGGVSLECTVQTERRLKEKF